MTTTTKFRVATVHDKDYVLNFCKNTFSWGDYIDRVWDIWIGEPNSIFLVAVVVNENKIEIPIAIAHGILIPEKTVWVEGIRVDQVGARIWIAERKRRPVHASGAAGRIGDSDLAARLAGRPPGSARARQGDRADWRVHRAGILLRPDVPDLDARRRAPPRRTRTAGRSGPGHAPWHTAGCQLHLQARLDAGRRLRFPAQEPTQPAARHDCARPEDGVR